MLAGVAVTSFLTAIQTFVQQLRIDELQRVYAWILGDVGGGWPQVRLIAPYAAVSTVVMLLHGRLLDVLSVGDEEATGLGVRTARVRFVVLLAASLATASAVAVSGLIAFVGIVVPHVVRRLAGWSYRIVLPLSFLGGAAFLVLADTIARTVLAPAELPIGVITAFVGAPFFVVILRMTRRVET
jgi:iron complex transport system permease protein